MHIYKCLLANFSKRFVVEDVGWKDGWFVVERYAQTMYRVNIYFSGNNAAEVVKGLKIQLT